MRDIFHFFMLKGLRLMFNFELAQTKLLIMSEAEIVIFREVVRKCTFTGRRNFDAVAGQVVLTVYGFALRFPSKGFFSEPCAGNIPSAFIGCTSIR